MGKAGEGGGRKGRRAVADAEEGKSCIDFTNFCVLIFFGNVAIVENVCSFFWFCGD